MAGSIIPLRFNSRFRLSWSSWDSPLPAVLNRPPRVAIPGFDASPPTLVWQTYNMQTKERGEIAKDGQSLGYSPASNTSSRPLWKISTAG
ncbi:MAG TPA: hypothetical protein VLD60_02140 [Nitrospira sp.]|nr:hypothetical protein [Nitrospira sp.]